MRAAIAHAEASSPRSAKKTTRKKPATKPALKKTRSSSATDHDNPQAVDQLLDALDHPLKPVVLSIRALILKAAKDITQGVKWNSPSFYCQGWFATVNIRPNHTVMLVLHHGAKSTSPDPLSDQIDDPAGLLHWHSPDRASITFPTAESFNKNRKHLSKIIVQWAARQRALVS
ncbi:MAG: DUF1801 domain-containing protein [Phycisphaerales bacterium]